MRSLGLAGRRFVFAIAALGAALALDGCSNDTALSTGKPDGGGGPETAAPETSAPETSAPDKSAPDTSTPETTPPACPAGPAAPLGEACSSAGQLCAYGYNPPECGGRTVVCTSGKWSEESHRDPAASCFDGGAHETGQPDVGADQAAANCVAAGGVCHIGGVCPAGQSINAPCQSGEFPMVCCGS